MEFEYIFQDPPYERSVVVDHYDGKYRHFRSKDHLYNIFTYWQALTKTSVISIQRKDLVPCTDQEVDEILNYFYPTKLGAREDTVIPSHRKFAVWEGPGDKDALWRKQIVPNP